MSTINTPMKHAATLHFTDGRAVSGFVRESKFTVHTHEATENFNTGGIEQIVFGTDLVSDMVQLRSRKIVHGSLAINHDKILFAGPQGEETIDRRNLRFIAFPEGRKDGAQ